MKYRRVLLKLSGEALSADSGKLYDGAFLSSISECVSQCLKSGMQLAIIVGAGNIWRGRQGIDMDRCRADSMGMLATVINAIALKDAFLRAGIKARVMTATHMEPYGDFFSEGEAITALENGEVVIFGGGLGQPFFSTDTAASLRAAQIKADAILLAKNIDGIYDRDPNGPDGANAVKLEQINCSDLVKNKLHAIDLTAATLNIESGIPCVTFALNPPTNILRAAMGEQIGTVICAD